MNKKQTRALNKMAKKTKMVAIFNVAEKLLSDGTLKAKKLREATGCSRTIATRVIHTVKSPFFEKEIVARYNSISQLYWKIISWEKLSGVDDFTNETEDRSDYVSQFALYIEQKTYEVMRYIKRFF